MRQLNDYKAFIEYSNDMAVIHKKYWKKKIQIKNVWFVFDLIAEILSHKKLNVIANESFIRDIKIFNLERI